MELKFRMIQSNDHGLITKPGDRTYAQRGPAKGEEALELPTLFIWVRGKDRYLSRCWTQWTGDRLGNDYIYVATRFRDVIDLEGDTRYHQWCCRRMRSELWTLQRAGLDISSIECPQPELTHEANRHKSAKYLRRRKQRLREQTPELSPSERELVKEIYNQRDRLNQSAGLILYHVDHIIPLSRGGEHHPRKLRVIRAQENLRKGATLTIDAS